MALTDHDTVAGWDDFRASCARYSIRPVFGVELSSKYDATVHILGYRIERPAMLRETLELARARRDDRNALMLSRLRGLGIPITMADVSANSRGQVIARPHFARALVALGRAKDVRDAFNRYLARGAAAYAPREGLSPAECVEAITGAGGLAVLAHPSLTKLDDDGLGELILSLKPHGLWGIECVSSHCSSEAAFGFFSLAKKFSLYPTAGSDFHGASRPGVSLGVQVSDDFLPWARLGVKF